MDQATIEADLAAMRAAETALMQDGAEEAEITLADGTRRKVRAFDRAALRKDINDLQARLDRLFGAGRGPRYVRSC